MALTSTRKAAVLLMSLEPATAAELLKSAEPEVITRIAAELAYLDSSGEFQADDAPAREFFALLRGSDKTPDRGVFLKEMLEGAVGPQRSEEMLGQVERMVQMRDPFRSIRSSDPARIAEALRGESPSVNAMVLAELPPARSGELLTMFDEDIRAGAVRCMASGQNVAPEAKLRVATAVARRLEEMNQPDAVTPKTATAAASDDQLRKVAVLLRELKTELRDELTQAITDENNETGEAVRKLMVTWDDIATIADRSMQEALRSVDSRRLALALIDADERICERVRSNISERARNMLEEEATLLSNPKEEEIVESREAILDALREMNAKGELNFDQQ